jgi:hypothetical protein
MVANGPASAAQLSLGPDPAAGLVEQHQDVEWLGGAGVIPGWHQHLDGYHLAVFGHRGGAVAQECRCVIVSPVHQRALDQVGVGTGGHGGEHVAADDLAAGDLRLVQGGPVGDLRPISMRRRLRS